MSDFNIEDQKLMLRNIGRFVRDEIRKAVEPLQQRIAELEMTGIKYCGTYQRAAQYKRGDVCNHDGGMWVATCETPPQEVPGKSVCWQLSVKIFQRQGPRATLADPGRRASVNDNGATTMTTDDIESQFVGVECLVGDRMRVVEFDVFRAAHLRVSEFYVAMGFEGDKLDLAIVAALPRYLAEMVDGAVYH